LFAATALFIQTGTADIQELHAVLLSTPPSGEFSLLVFAMLFLGLSIPMMIFPGNFWAVDVVQGAPSGAGAFLAAGIRAAAFAVAARIWFALFAQPALEPGKWIPLGSWDWTQWLAVSSGLSLVMPALLSIRQTDARRLISCVALVEGGFLLLGLVVLEELGLAAILFSLLIGTASFIGVLYVLSLSVARTGGSDIASLRGSLRGRPWETVSMLCFSACWLGLPPFGGSVARFALLGAAIRREWHLLAALGLLAMTLTVIATGRLLLQLLLPLAAPGEQRDAEPAEGSRSRQVFLLSLLVPLALSTFLAEPLLRWASLSLRFIFW
jgi:NADH-quinone oxidoreductase subunit N